MPAPHSAEQGMLARCRSSTGNKSHPVPSALPAREFAAGAQLSAPHAPHYSPHVSRARGLTSSSYLSLAVTAPDVVKFNIIFPYPAPAYPPPFGARVMALAFTRSACASLSFQTRYHRVLTVPFLFPKWNQDTQNGQQRDSLLPPFFANSRTTEYRCPPAPWASLHPPPVSYGKPRNHW